MGGRPAKSVGLLSSNISTEEYRARKDAEEKLKGRNDKIKPLKYLNKNAKKIFKTIVTELKESDILCNLDIYILSSCAVALDRIQSAEELLEENILNKEARIVQDTYMRQFFRLCNELCLSPQSRSKLANAAYQSMQEDNDPVLEALRGDD
ncbi:MULTISPECIES: phage terminase small subunit P27 family [Psychrilyobacter]|uniref:Phage terminase small subunit P27 family n=1 Tax=Psychrilyobacter piezotolerans TaxID=2293438 RepID=A0ABX9KIN9_9FUSO|nr:MULTISPECIES: phage terminase small subunit P27 family [Psychrilyobacter]MCS5420760.1 phage terminase small subunit P27 family [Psychrilyobacter sp. S5]NDI77446.1 phage terminase small subunit P27 family [Psychrilyobacter piezotolerans]RDE63749.1 phage terminase small subunit P27 family [Psychrilyobacter sp. S5]REI42093.1 phage terminase small subunit P27 family [Psychrilyobacter piezotolerans]